MSGHSLGQSPDVGKPAHADFLQSLITLALFCFVLIGLLTAFFYLTPLRHSVENKLYDLRTRIKPDYQYHDQLVIVSVDEGSVKSIEGDGVTDLSFDSLNRILQKLKASDARAIVVMLYPHLFDYYQPQLSQFASIVASDERIYVGTLGLDTKVPSVRELPEPLIQVANRVAGLEIYRARRHDFTRQMPLYSYRGQELLPLLPLRLALDLNPALVKQEKPTTNDSFWLNYIAESRFDTVKSEDFFDISKHKTVTESIRDKVVFLGYTIYRERLINSNQINVNTPWQSEGADPAYGMPLVKVTASAFLNLYQTRFLTVSPVWSNILQTSIVTLMSIGVWWLGITPAILVLSFLWVAIFYVHGALFTHFRLLLPLADTLMFSSMGVMLGCLWRSQLETRARASQEIRAEALQRVAKMQASFLLMFSKQLHRLNEEIHESLAAQRELIAVGGVATVTILQKLHSSIEDFRDYSLRMVQFATLEDKHVRHLSIRGCELKFLVDRIAAQFQSRCEEAAINIDNRIANDAVIYTDETYLDPILFNFISNAVKYSPKGGTVAIRLKSSGENEVAIEVSDQGPGIDQAYHTQIFEKFFRVPDERVHKVKGTGLGLYLCQFFATKIRAKLAVESQPGGGAKFCIYLPRRIGTRMDF